MYTIEIHTLKLRYPNTKLRMTLLALSVKEQGFLFFFKCKITFESSEKNRQFLDNQERNNCTDPRGL